MKLTTWSALYPNKNYGGCYDASTQSYNCLRIGVSKSYSWCIDTVQVIEVEATSMGIAAPSMPNFLLAPVKQLRLPCRFDCTTLSYRYTNFSDPSATIFLLPWHWCIIDTKHVLAPIKQFRLPCRFDCTTLSYWYSNFSDHSAVIIYIIIFGVHT